MKRLAHLNALRAFEISARLGSFARAAEELCVTPAAVSQQVRLLEGYLGVILFHRRGQRLGPTAEALQMLPDVALGFERLSTAFQRLGQSRGQRARRIRVAAPPAFVVNWMVPRLQRFREAHPDVELRVGSCAQAIDFGSNEFDIHVGHGLGDRGALQAWPLFTDALFPVCSPSVRATMLPGPDLARLSDCVLIHEDSAELDVHGCSWDAFLRQFEVPLRARLPALRFTDPLSATLAAREGCGVLLGRQFLVNEDLERGTLVRPFPSVAIAGPVYQVAYPSANCERVEILALRDWLLEEAAIYCSRLRGGAGDSPDHAPRQAAGDAATRAPIRAHAAPCGDTRERPVGPTALAR